MSDTKEKALLRTRLHDHPFSFVLVCMSFLIVVASSVYAYNDGSALAALEVSIFRYINSLPDWLTPFFIITTNIATLGAVITAGFVALIGKRRRIGLAILLSGSLGWLIPNILKEILGRERPAAFLSDIAVRYTGLAGGNGFPSGHAAVAAASAMSLALILPRRYAPFLILTVFLVGVSRVYLGVHLPLDVVGGWAIGIVIGYVVDILLRVEKIRGKKVA